jgi:hypothetical protein
MLDQAGQKRACSAGQARNAHARPADVGAVIDTFTPARHPARLMPHGMQPEQWRSSAHFGAYAHLSRLAAASS